MTCYLFFLLSGTVNFLDSSSSFKSLIAHIDQLANHRGRLIYSLHKKSTSDRLCIHGSAWGRQSRQYVGKKLPHCNNTSQRTEVHRGHCSWWLALYQAVALLSQSQENKELHPLPRIVLFSVHKQAQQSLFQTLDLSASSGFFADSSPLCECPLRKGTSAFISYKFSFCCLFCCLFCFCFVLLWGKGGVIT